MDRAIRLALALALVYAQEDSTEPYNPYKFYYEWDVMPELGRECFVPEALMDFDGFELYTDDDDGEFAEVRTVVMAESSICWFAAYDNFKISAHPKSLEEGGDATISEDIQIYYWPFTGMGPDMRLNGREKCVFEPQEEVNFGKLDSWFKVNYFGGACGYMVMLAVPEDHPDFEMITITKQYENGQGIYDAASMLSVSLLAGACLWLL